MNLEFAFYNFFFPPNARAKRSYSESAGAGLMFFRALSHVNPARGIVIPSAAAA